LHRRFAGWADRTEYHQQCGYCHGGAVITGGEIAMTIGTKRVGEPESFRLMALGVAAVPPPSGEERLGFLKKM